MASRHGVNENSSLDIVFIELLIGKSVYSKYIDAREIGVLISELYINHTWWVFLYKSRFIF